MWRFGCGAQIVSVLRWRCQLVVGVMVRVSVMRRHTVLSQRVASTKVVLLIAYIQKARLPLATAGRLIDVCYTVPDVHRVIDAGRATRNQLQPCSELASVVRGRPVPGARELCLHPPCSQQISVHGH
jgi:hypothetical protein